MSQNISFDFSYFRLIFKYRTLQASIQTSGVIDMKELLFFLLVVAVWFLLQAYVLPKFGVKTWLMPKRQVAGEKVKEGKTQSKVYKIK